MGKETKVTKPSSILISTFAPWKNGKRSTTNGMIEPMLSYFLPNVEKVWLLDQPYPGSDKYYPVVERYYNGKLDKYAKTSFIGTLLLPWLLVTNTPATHVSFKFRDLFSTIEAGFQSKEAFDIFVGMESVNALAGIVLRKLGKVKKVCYYVSDYSPLRFQSKLLNDFYLWLDRIAAQHADFIWDVSPAMQPARISAGLDSKKSAPVIHVPNALFPNQLHFVPFEKREKQTVVFVGTIGLENGPDIAIEAFAEVVKSLPKAKLHIIGGGGKGFEEEYLKKLIIKYKLDKNVFFHGFISDLHKLSEMIKYFQIAIAPYKMIPGSVRLYGDATKLRLYAAVGLPVITTSVPPLGRELEEKEAAVVVKDTKNALAKEIIRLLKNPKEMQEMMHKSKKFGENNIWDNTYGNALKQMAPR